MALKLCRVCRILLPTTLFSARTRSLDGLEHFCKTCYSSYAASQAARRSPLILAQARQRTSVRKAQKRGRPMRRRPYRTFLNPLGLPPEDRS